MTLFSLIRPARAVPAEYRATFLHLYFDILWFGVLNGSALSFLAVYAARQGANSFQLGLLAASGALVNLFLTLPVGRWLAGRHVGKAVFWAAVFHRLFYLLWVPLPVLLPPSAQVWAFIGITFLMSIPGVVLAVGFNALFADAVPPEWRGHVVGVRNALFALAPERLRADERRLVPGHDPSQPRLEDGGRLVDVLAVEAHAGLEAQRVARAEPAGPQPRGPAGVEEGVPHARRRGGRHEDLEPVLAGVARARDRGPHAEIGRAHV